MSDAAVHQPSPAKRGRGRGRGGTARGGASARARGKPAAGRRGRAKVYDNSRAQAAHERQRDLKNAYATLAAAMKPALEELAERNLDRLRSDFNAHKEVDQYHEITSFLDQRFKEREADLSTARDLSINTTTHELMAKNEYVQQGYQVCFLLFPFYPTSLIFPYRCLLISLTPAARMSLPTRLMISTTRCSDVPSCCCNCPTMASLSM